MVAELNGAVEFNDEYAPWGDVFSDAASLLAWEARATGVTGGMRSRPESA